MNILMRYINSFIGDVSWVEGIIQSSAGNFIEVLSGMVILQSMSDPTITYTAIAVALLFFFLFIINKMKNKVLRNHRKNLEESITRLSDNLKQKNFEIQKADESVHSMQEQLIESEKMASLGQLTAGIAHEIQNPLNFINNFSEVSIEMLEELHESTPEERKKIETDIKQNLEKIHFHGKRADSIVKGMLQQSRTAPAEKQPTDINKLVEEFFVLAYHGMRAKEPGFNCSIEKHLASNLPMVRIIPQDVSRVILNVFNNSFYAVDEKSKSEGKNYRPTVSISTRQVNGSIALTIRDNGKGIPEDVRSKIFNPFFTTKPTGRGTGLGLSISHEIIVNGHNGEIQLDSKPGEFTEFVITLPI